MTAERIASLRRDLIAQSTGDQAKERNELCDLAEESINPPFTRRKLKEERDAAVYEALRLREALAVADGAPLRAAAREQGRREGLQEALEIARRTKEDGYALAKKAHTGGDAKQSHYWVGESEGAAEIERDIMNLLGIDWANGETEAKAAALPPRGENEET